MLQLIKNKKGQAAVEIAIIGSVIILAFASLISLTERVNRTQHHVQEVFNAHLASAKKSGDASSAAVDAYYRAPNIMDPYAPGELVKVKNSGHVLWGGTKSTDPSIVSDEKWTATEQWSHIIYKKKLIREGEKAYHEVRYPDPITGKNVVRGEYANK